MSTSNDKHFCVDMSNAFSPVQTTIDDPITLLNDERLQAFKASDKLSDTDLEHMVRVTTSGTIPDDFTLAQRKQARLVLDLLRMWRNGSVLRVRFLGGDAYLQGKVEQYARTWEQHANIHFDFVRSGPAEIRVAFKAGLGSWSLVGRDALLRTDQTQPTMNFGWFDQDTPEMEFSRTVIHEFGHALGCQHEHQSPAGNIQWNKPVVYAEYKADQGWSSQDVDHNVFRKFTSGTVTNSAFDPDSIMLYPIPAHHTVNGFSVGMNLVLSPTDRAFIAQHYPKPNSGSTP